MSEAVGRIEEIDYIDVRSVGPHAEPRIVPKGAILSVRGWATVTELPGVSTGVYVGVDDALPLEASYGIDRPDVAEVFGSEAYASAGFRALLSTAHLDAGLHTVVCSVRDDEGQLLPIEGSEEFTIEAPFDQLVLESPRNESTPIRIDAIEVDGEPSDEPIVAGATSVVTITGWAVDRPRMGLGRSIFAVIGTLVVRGSYGLPRPDVVADQGGDRYLESGFAIGIPLDVVDPGSHSIAIRMVGADGATVYDGPELSLDVTDHIVETAALLAAESTTLASIDEVVVLDREGNICPPGASGLQATRGDQLFIRGWAIDSENDSPARAVYIGMDRTASVPTNYGLDRQDVAAVLERPHLVACGFTAFVPTAGMPAGMHRMSLRVIDQSGKRFFETSQQVEFEVTDARLED